MTYGKNNVSKGLADFELLSNAIDDDDGMQDIWNELSSHAQTAIVHSNKIKKMWEWMISFVCRDRKRFFFYSKHGFWVGFLVQTTKLFISNINMNQNCEGVGQIFKIFWINCLNSNHDKYNVHYLSLVVLFFGIIKLFTGKHLRIYRRYTTILRSLFGRLFSGSIRRTQNWSFRFLRIFNFLMCPKK